MHLTPGCEFWGLLNSMLIFIFRLRKCYREKQSQRAIENETLARCTIYLEESLRPFGLDISAATGIQFVNTCIEPLGQRQCCEATDRQEPLVTTVWTWCPHAVCSSPIWPPLCLLMRGYEIAANMMWCVELSATSQEPRCLFYLMKFFLMCVCLSNSWQSWYKYEKRCVSINN